MNRRKRVWIPESPMLNLRHYTEVGVINGAAGVKGFFDVELIHTRTGLVKYKATFPNLVTNVGLDALFTVRASDLIMYLAVGTGTSIPDPTDTALEAEVGRTSNTGGFPIEQRTEGSGHNIVYHEITHTRVFGNDEANGNLGELGIFNLAAGGVLYNRQRFRNEQGNPTTITKTSEDQLRVRYRMRIYPPMDDDVQEAMVGGALMPVTVRASRVDQLGLWGAQFFGGDLAFLSAYSGPVGGRAATPTGTQVAGSTSVAAYVPGSHQREFEASWAPSEALFPTGVQSFGSSQANNGSFPRFQMELDSPLMKQDSERMIVQASWSIAEIEP